MRETITIPLKRVGAEKWAELSAAAPSGTHHLCGEKFQMREENNSFLGQHRVRLISFKKNVWWKIPEGFDLDISDVREAPLRRPQRR